MKTTSTLSAVFFLILLSSCSQQESSSTEDEQIENETTSNELLDEKEKDSPQEEKVKEYEIDLNLEEVHESGFGRSFGRPYDTVMSANRIDFVYENEVIFSDKENNYTFYKVHDEYYPRKLQMNDHLYYIVERNEGISVCEGFSVLTIFKFDEDSFIDSCSLCPLDAGVDLSEVQTNDELREIVERCF